MFSLLLSKPSFWDSHSRESNDLFSLQSRVLMFLPVLCTYSQFTFKKASKLLSLILLIPVLSGIENFTSFHFGREQEEQLSPFDSYSKAGGSFEKEPFLASKRSASKGKVPFVAEKTHLLLSRKKI